MLARKNCFCATVCERGESIDRSIGLIDDHVIERISARVRETERERLLFPWRVLRYMTDVCAAPFADGTWMACNYRSFRVLVIVSALSGRRFSCLGEEEG